jgi:hypothetical protein
MLTARQLVAELSRLGAGHWTPDAVRQWLREELPCPVAAHGVLGQPHRYDLVEVLVWLIARAKRERVKGHTRGDGADPAQQLERALALARNERQAHPPQTDHAKVAPHQGTPGAVAGSGADRSGAPAHGMLGAPARVAAAPAAASLQDGADKADPDVQLLARALGLTVRAVERALSAHALVVSRFRDPRNAKAHEEMRLARMRADEAEGKLVPAEEVERLLADIVLPARSGLLALKGELGAAIESCSTVEARRAAIEQRVDTLLEQLAAASPTAAMPETF